MTLTEKSSRKVIVGSGWANPLTHDYVIESASWVHVFADTVELTQGVDYTVTNVLNPAGYAVTIAVPGSWAPTSWVLNVVPPIDQQKDLTVGGTFGAKYEDGLDKLSRRLQYVWDLARRGLKTSLLTPVGNDNYNIPAPVAGMVWGWNAAATDLENKPGLTSADITAFNAQVAAASASASAAGTQAGNASASATASANSASAALGSYNATVAAIAALGNPLVFQGAWDASAGTFPGGGTAKAGYEYIVAVAGTVGGVVFALNDVIIATANNASTTVYAANWYRLQSDRVNSVAGLTGAITSADLRNVLTASPYVATRTALKALDTTKDGVAYLTEGRRSGVFVWTTGNFSTQVTADTSEGIYIKATAIASTVGAWVRALRGVIDPFMFGGAGDGTTDDGVALNAMFAVIRAEAATANGVASNQVATTIELSGGSWKTTTSINVTGIVGWNFTVRGGLIIGSCAGKAVIDLVGSRGYQFFGVGVYGDPAAKPSAGFQAARPTAAGFCDNASFYDCSTSGYFTRAAFHDYGQESTLHVHPTYFNSQHDARVAIFSGYDSDPFTSDYTTVMTGATSHINNKVINGDFRYLPGGTNIAVVSGVTNAASAVITATAHPFANGDEVVFANIGGMPGMSNAIGTVSAAGANSFTVNINSTALGTYTSGGTVIRRATKSPVLFSRGRQFHFDCSYIVSYGRPGLEIAWPDAGFLVYDQIVLDILFEGAGCASNLLLSPGANAASIAGFTLKTYQSNAYTSLISIVDAGTVGLINPLIECSNPITANVPLGVTAGKLGLFGARILYAGIANIVLTSYATGSHGVVVDFNTGKITEITSDPVDQTYTPTALSGTGTVTTFGTVVGTVRGGFGKMTWLELDIPITTNGTGATSITATLPGTITPKRDAFLLGRENSISGKSVIGLCVAASGTITIFNYDNTYPGATGARIKLSGWFERT